MHPWKLLLLLLPIILIISVSSVDGQYQTCFNDANFTANDIFQTNLDTLLNSIATIDANRLVYGFLDGNFEAIEMIGYCRGDITGLSCLTCLNSSANQVRQLCPVQKEAVIFPDECTFKYSNGSLFGVLDTRQPLIVSNENNASNWDDFWGVLKPLLDDLRGQAASGGPFRKYGEGSNFSVDSYTLYAAVQCSPDLSNQQCDDCLVNITGLSPQGKVGGRVLTASCQLRYETSRFFDPVINPPSPSPAPEPTVLPPPSAQPVNLGNKKSSKTSVAIGASIASVVLLVGILAILLGKRKRGSTQVQQNEDADNVIVAESLQFNLDTIRDSTENFSDAKKLGQGGFGSVFQGKLSSGQEIAIKRLEKNSGQGELEFKNEVELLAKLRHRNLVRLLGFCIEGDERLLIYELMPNSSLDHFIFDPIKRAGLDWDTRYKIIAGIAQGILYLHEDSGFRIIHRDLKASNILLDAEMNTKVSDFGLARLFQLDQTQLNTNRIVGTYGYMAPEYILHGHFSRKSDVYSFGVLVLEIVSGRKNRETHHEEDSESEILITHAWRKWTEGKIHDIIDPAVSSGDNRTILRCIHIGLLCIQENMTNRPTMSSVTQMLNSHSILPVLTQPAFLMNSSYATQIPSTLIGTLKASLDDNTGDTTCPYSVNGASITEPFPR